MARIFIVTLLAALLVQQIACKYDKSSLTEMNNELKNLYAVLGEVQADSKTTLNPQLENLLAVSKSTFRKNRDVVYGTLASSLNQIQAKLSLADRYHINAENCREDAAENELRTIAEDAVKQSENCTKNQENYAANLVSSALGDVGNLKAHVDGLAKEVAICNDDVCAAKVTRKIKSASKAIPTKGAAVVDNAGKSLKTVESNVNQCMEKLIRPAVMKLAALTSDAVQCIVEILAENGHL